MNTKHRIWRAFTLSALVSLGAAKAQCTLQLLHASDLEGGVDAVADAPNFAAGSKAAAIRDLTDAVQDIVIAKDAEVYGSSAVFLEGRRSAVRTEETNLGNLTADAFPDAELLQTEGALGRLRVTDQNGDFDGDGDLDQIFAYGARSFSIWELGSRRLHQVYDSGADLENITASLVPAEFNSTNDENGSFDSRSDDKGPEPEGIAIGEIDGRSYAFIGLERIGGIMVYDITDPTSPFYVQYLVTRDFFGDAEEGTAGDLGPEGIEFIPAAESPNGRPLLLVANEVSGSLTVIEIE